MVLSSGKKKKTKKNFSIWWLDKLAFSTTIRRFTFLHSMLTYCMWACSQQFWNSVWRVFIAKKYVFEFKRQGIMYDSVLKHSHSYLKVYFSSWPLDTGLTTFWPEQFRGQGRGIIKIYFLRPVKLLLGGFCYLDVNEQVLCLMDFTPVCKATV